VQHSFDQSALQVSEAASLDAEPEPALRHVPYLGKVAKESDMSFTCADAASSLDQVATTALDGSGTQPSEKSRFIDGIEETLRIKLERQQSKERSGENALEALGSRSSVAANIQVIDERLAERFAKQQQKERAVESSVEAGRLPGGADTLGLELQPAKPQLSAANIQIIDERLAQRFAQQRQKELTGESAVEEARTPDAAAKLAEASIPGLKVSESKANVHMLSETMPDSLPDIQLPRLLGARAPDLLQAVMKKPALEESAPPVGLVAERIGTFQRSETDPSAKTSMRKRRDPKRFVVEVPSDGLVSQRKLIFNRGLSMQSISVSHR
jgi:hypothetical protein